METAAEAVVAMPWQDDAGARTADLYDWQASMAAADGLSLALRSITGGEILETINRELICEHHEDWTIIDGPTAELVSAKHREPASGAWTTINQLVNKGGLRHLFDRWLALQKLPSLRLVTCAALASDDCKDLAKATNLLRDEEQGVQLSAESAKLVDQCVQKLAKELLTIDIYDLPTELRCVGKSRWTDLSDQDIRTFTLRAYLARLVIDQRLINREHVAHAAPTMYVTPLLEQLQRLDVPAASVWKAVLDLFRARMRAQGPVPGGMLPLVLAAAEGSLLGTTAAAQDRELAKRRITVSDVHVAIREAFENAPGYLPLKKMQRLTPLGLKMASGGCADTSIERAEDLRSDYVQYYRERNESLPGARAEQRQVERWLLRMADEETSKVDRSSEEWGAALWRNVSDRIVTGYSNPRFDGDPIELDGDLALGGLCELTNRCKVWFSPSFDVRAELVSRRAHRRGES